VGELRHADAAKVNVSHGYHIREVGDETLFRASRWLAECASEAMAQSGVDAQRQRVVAIVGTGLRELRAVERSALEPLAVSVERLHFAHAVHQACPHIREVVTISNACSAGGHAMALAQDLIELGEADAVLVAATDTMTESMLAMIGRFAEVPTDQVRPFDAKRTGVLLGEGAAAFILVPEGWPCRPLARLLSTGLSCDASHETVLDPEGIRRAIDDAFTRAGRTPAQVDLVIAHGTGTAINDPVEATLIRQVLACGRAGPLITAIKGAIGHTSGGAALAALDVAQRCLATGQVPAIVGLREPLQEGKGLRFVIGEPVKAPIRLAHIQAFGFGGVNAITLLEKAA